MNGLDLFSGIGGISRALRRYVHTHAYCESDRYCQGVLLSRMHAGDLDPAPIWEDVRTFPTYQLEGQIDIVCAGFPCQDISCSGRGRGLEGDRSGLFSRSSGLPMELDRLSYSWKTFQGLPVEGSIASRRSLPSEGMTRGGKLFRLRSSERRTSGKGGGFLPTPTASEADRGPSMGIPGAKQQRHRTLSAFARSGNWPRIGPGIIRPGLLNPNWIEWLMGYPTGWTACAPWVIQWFRSRPKPLSSNCLESKGRDRNDTRDLEVH